MKKAKKGRKELPFAEKKTQVPICLQNQVIEDFGGKERVQEKASAYIIREAKKIIKK